MITITMTYLVKRDTGTDLCCQNKNGRSSPIGGRRTGYRLRPRHNMFRQGAAIWGNANRFVRDEKSLVETTRIIRNGFAANASGLVGGESNNMFIYTHHTLVLLLPFWVVSFVSYCVAISIMFSIGINLLHFINIKSYGPWPCESSFAGYA